MISVYPWVGGGQRPYYETNKPLELASILTTDTIDY